MLGSIYIPIQQPPAQLVTQSYANGLTVSAPRHIIDVDQKTEEWLGGVTATYGPTTITADRMTLHLNEEDPYGETIGHVKLIDPEGTITAADLTFHWKTKTGTGHAVNVNVSMLQLQAESVDIQPDLWTLRNVGATGCKLKTPLYYIHTREVRIRPNKAIRAIRPQISIFGQKLITLPTQSLTFGGSGTSFDLPYPTYRPQRGFGINWSNQIEMGTETALFTRYAVYQHSLPFYNAAIMHSLLKGEKPETIRTEIGDRLGFGYFDSVQVRSPDSERQYLATRRLDIGLASTFGADAGDTTSLEEKINKPIEFVGQASGEIASFAAYGLVRAQQVRIGNGPAKNRVIFEQNLLSPSYDLGKNLSAFARLDAAEFVGGNRYNWVRGQAGVAYDTLANIRLGVSYTSSRAWGMPDFPYDAPFRSHEVGMRADLDFDTTQIRLLLKYDPTQQAIFDRELYFSQVIGCIEPFMVYRERPHKFFVGIKLPINRVFDRLLKVKSEREKAMRSTISGPPQQ
jgi:hypothetical protein